MSTFTKEDLDAAVAEATAPLLEELNTLKSSQEEQEINARIEELKTEHASQVAELQAQLDSAVLERDTSKGQYDELVAALESAEAAEVEAAIFAAVREERIAQVKEVASFSDEHIEASADRWAAMEQDAFEASLSDWSAAVESAKAVQSGEESGEEALSFQTAFQASQEDRQESGGVDPVSARAELMSAKLIGVDFSTI